MSVSRLQSVGLALPIRPVTSSTSVALPCPALRPGCPACLPPCLPCAALPYMPCLLCLLCLACAALPALSACLHCLQCMPCPALLACCSFWPPALIACKSALTILPLVRRDFASQRASVCLRLGSSRRAFASQRVSACRPATRVNSSSLCFDTCVCLRQLRPA